VAGRTVLVLDACVPPLCAVISAGNAEPGVFSPFHVNEYSCSVGDGSIYGKSVFAGVPLPDGTCDAPTVSEGFLRIEADGALFFETRTRLGDDYSGANGVCSEAGAERASIDKPCSSYERVRASRL